VSVSAATPPALRDPAWTRRVFWVCVAAVLCAPALVATEFKPWVMAQPAALQATLGFVGDFFPPRSDTEFLVLVAREAWRTVAMATAGVVLALLVAIPAALLATSALSVSALSSLRGRMGAWPWIARQGVRAVLIVLRSVPELVWALVFVRVVGLGVTAGVLAIALTYSGMLGKVYSEILDSGPRHASATLLRSGAGRLQAFFYALLPQNAPELASYTIYRWECAIRSSTVLGFVGAGGLGQLMDASMKMFNGAEVSMVLLVFIALVWFADAVSGALRKVLD